MLVKDFMAFINQIKMDKYLIKNIVSFYYPEFNKLKIHENYKGEIIYAAENQKIFDPKPINKIYQEAKIRAREKLNLL